MHSLLKWLLRLYPEDFREAHGANLLRAYSEFAHGRGASAFGSAFRAAMDLTSGAIGVRWDRLRESLERGREGVRTHRPMGRGGRDMAGNLFSDIRYAIRGLGRTPGFTVMAVLTIALGLGAGTAIFSVVNGVLLSPLPYPDSDELVAVWSRFLPESGFDFPRFAVDPTEYVDFRDTNRSMESVAAYSRGGMTITGPEGGAERVQAVFTTWNLFPLLESQASRGRVLLADDDRPGGDFVVVISDDFWRTRLGEDPDVVGRAVTLNGNPATIVGVMPPGFSYPAPGVDMWSPLQLDPQNLGNRQSHYLTVIARLRDDVLFEAAQSDTESMMERWETDYPDIHTGHFLFVTPLQADQVRNVRTALLLLFGAVGFVLLVVCANVANLLLVRGQSRIRESAIRIAIGASRWRILQLGLTESAILALVGGAVGLVLALGGVRAMVALAGGGIPRPEAIGIDASVLLFSIGLTAITALIFGIAPALQGSGAGSSQFLREDGRSGSASRLRLRSRNALVAIEVALSIVLVLGAGLLTKSFWKLMHDDPGFRAEGALVANIGLPSSKYPTNTAALLFFDELMERASALPGVESIASTTHLPMASGQSVNDFQVEGMPAPGSGEPTWNAGLEVVRSSYFDVMGMTLVRGRLFDERDHATSVPTMVISKGLEEKFFAGHDALGMRMGLSGDSIWFEIIGIVSDVDHAALGSPGEPVYYAAQEQMPRVAASLSGFWSRFATLVVRTSSDPLLIAEPLRSTVYTIDPDLPLVGVQSLETVVGQSVSQARFVMILMAVFAGLAMLLGTIGIYGVTSFVVSQRHREIGIRKALGAEQGSVIGMVLAQGMGPIGLGMVVGIVGAVASGRVMASMLFDVSATDVTTYIGVTVLLGLVAFIAAWLPARRAARVDPMDALRPD